MTDITLNIKEVNKAFDDLIAKQLPFAAAKALTKTAKDAQKALDRQVDKKIDRPTPFTRRSFGVSPAKKSKLLSSIFIKDIQAGYLKYLVDGGVRVPKGGKGAFLVPVNIRLNKFGNIPGLRRGAKVEKLLARPNTFKGTIRGVSGIWQRHGPKKRKVKLLLRFEDSATYQERFPFYKITTGVARSRLNRNLKDSIDFAIKTARR